MKKSIFLLIFAILSFQPCKPMEEDLCHTKKTVLFPKYYSEWAHPGIYILNSTIIPTKSVDTKLVNATTLEKKALDDAMFLSAKSDGLLSCDFA